MDDNDDHDESLSPTWDLDEFSDSDMEDLVEVPKPDMNTPVIIAYFKFSLANVYDLYDHVLEYYIMQI